MNDGPHDEPEGLEIPYGDLSADALRGVIESFVLREGTEYGAADVPLEEKVAAVLRQLARDEARIVFDPRTGSVDIVPAGPAPGWHVRGTERV